jgi:hypothetical protein
MPTKTPVRTPVLAALLHELAKACTWACYADLAEDLKTEAARLRLPYDSATVDAAIAQVEHVTGRSLVGRLPPVRECWCTAPPTTDVAPIGRAEAAELYRALLERAAREKVPA